MDKDFQIGIMLKGHVLKLKNKVGKLHLILEKKYPNHPIENIELTPPQIELLKEAFNSYDAT